MHQPVVVLGPADLHRLIEGESRARCRRADGVLCPVRAGDESHALGERLQLAAAFDPQQPTGLIAHGDDDPASSGVPGRSSARIMSMADASGCASR